MGRALIREPDFLQRAAAEAVPGPAPGLVRDAHSLCTHCNACVVATMADSHVVCPLRPLDPPTTYPDIEDAWRGECVCDCACVIVCV